MFFFKKKSIKGREKCIKIVTVVISGQWDVGFLQSIFLLVLLCYLGIPNCGGDNGQPYLISDFSGNTSDSSHEVHLLWVSER